MISFGFIFSICDSVHDVEHDYSWPMLIANSIWKYFLKYAICSFHGFCNLQSPGYHLYFQKDFQLRLAVTEGEILFPDNALG